MKRIVAVAAVAIALLAVSATAEDGKGVRFARFRTADRVVHGIVEGERVREIEGDLFGAWIRTDRVHALGDVELLVPVEPKHVFALAGNYKSHLKEQEIPPKFRIPQPFLKTVSSLAPQGSAIVIPRDSSGDVHYEAEMVVVVGKRARNVPRERALEYVFGVTCGNDVSERFWQNDEDAKDVQWWRAKGADTFGPCGPFLATGLEYDDLELVLRLNGEVRQKERTSYQIHDVAACVSFISRHVTLEPGDLIFTGTPGKTDVIEPGDVVEVELEGVGVLRNDVVAEE